MFTKKGLSSIPRLCRSLQTLQTQARPGRAVKQEQEQHSRNHVQAFLVVSVLEKDLDTISEHTV